MSQIELIAEARADVGKGASRRLRRKALRVPGIVYGGGEVPQNISLVENDLAKAVQSDTFFSQILALNIGGTRNQVLARDMQRHPATNRPMHIDFQRILANQEITVAIPLHFANAKLTRRWEFPVLGRDTETVLREVVGYDPATIAAHKADGVLD